MIRKLYEDVYYWTERHGTEPKTYDWNSYAVQIPQEGVLALVDPLPLSTDEIRALEELGPPTHIVLTCNWHLRESPTYVERWGCRILAHERGLVNGKLVVDDVYGDGDHRYKGDQGGIEIDGVFGDGELLWSTVEVVQFPEIYWPEECALLVKQGRGCLIVGDALCGSRADIGIPEGEIGIFTTQHITDREAARRSVDDLLVLPFDVICFGHGSPVVRESKAALRRFIEETFGKSGNDAA
ncbi:MAG: hypothetical protein O3A46_07995 [Candidatus Poribacteria bacterium]|nr:hypothetical protein [Candidatus Poribacteria bacterium]